jgi:hypothetical protein
MSDAQLQSGPSSQPRRGLLRSLLIGAAASGLLAVVLLVWQGLDDLKHSWSNTVAFAVSGVAFGAALGWVIWVTRTWRAVPAVGVAGIAGGLIPVFLLAAIVFAATWATGAGARGNFAGRIGSPVTPWSAEAASNAWNNALLGAMYGGVILAPLGAVAGAAAGLAGRFRRTAIARASG